MIPKPTDSIAVAPVSRIMPALPVLAIGDQLQELNARANQFAIGQDYIAKVLSRVDDQTVNVRIDNALFRMKLGADIAPGQMVNLKFLNHQPNPTFLFSGTSLPGSTVDTAAVSKTGQMIAQYLHESEARPGSSQVYQASSVITQMPLNPQMVANDLRHAIAYSGLFYESHLAEYTEGKRSLAMLMQEPQNRINFDPATLVVKQLEVFEQNKLQWNGQVWPGQAMHWTIQIDQALQDARNQREAYGGEVPEHAGISSMLVLELPNLGKVAARLHMHDGELRVLIEAEEVPATIRLKSELRQLADSLQKHGQKLESLMVKQHEQS